jgi:hypothetical protein
MAIAGAACSVGTKASAIGSAQSAARAAHRKYGGVKKALEKMRFTGRDCITAQRLLVGSADFGCVPRDFGPVGSRPLILRRNCGIGPGHGVAVICAD